MPYWSTEINNIYKRRRKMIPYYTEMDNIIERLKELGKMDYPQKRSYKMADGGWVTEDVPEYLEEQSLIARWNELQAYERALAPGYCRNRLMISLRLDLIASDLSKESYDSTLASRIAVSVYTNQPVS
jgi:hypothetical protein